MKNVKNNITLDVETQKALSNFRSQLAQYEDIHSKNNEMAIKKAILFANEYYKLIDYGSPNDITKQIFGQ